jgi:hypothetical protein
MLGRSLAAHCWQLHAAAERGDAAAARRLDRLSAAGVRAGQCHIDLGMQWHRHPGQLDPCDDTSCPEASDPVAWAASWELYWPPGQHPGQDGVTRT